MMQPVGTFCIAHDHPSLPGHFPGRPVVPGVVLLDATLALILAQRPGRAAAGLPAVKFTQPVQPGQSVTVSCGDGSDRILFACAVGGREVLRGTLTLDARQ